MGKKIYCKDLQKEIDWETCHSHRAKRQICKGCPFNKDYPLFNRATDLYKESYPSYSEILQRRYKEDKNPVWLFLTFTEGVRYGFNIPLWVINKIDEVFQKFLYDTFEKDRNPSLDRLFGCIGGRGQKPVRVMLELRERDVRLMTDMGMLRQRGIDPTDAARIVYEFNKPLIDYREIRKKYYSKKWNVPIKKIVNYDDPKRIKDLLKSAPKEIKIKKRYQKIF